MVHVLVELRDLRRRARSAGAFVPHNQAAVLGRGRCLDLDLLRGGAVEGDRAVAVDDHLRVTGQREVDDLLSRLVEPGEEAHQAVRARLHAEDHVALGVKGKRGEGAGVQVVEAHVAVAVGELPGVVDGVHGEGDHPVLLHQTELGVHGGRSVARLGGQRPADPAARSGRGICGEADLGGAVRRHGDGVGGRGHHAGGQRGAEAVVTAYGQVEDLRHVTVVAVGHGAGDRLVRRAVLEEAETDGTGREERPGRCPADVHPSRALLVSGGARHGLGGGHQGVLQPLRRPVGVLLGEDRRRARHVRGGHGGAAERRVVVVDDLAL